MDDEESLAEKREIYAAQRDDANITKKAVIDRILGQDWVCSLELVSRNVDWAFGLLGHANCRGGD
jgi:hypothetical protein